MNNFIPEYIFIKLQIYLSLEQSELQSELQSEEQSGQDASILQSPEHPPPYFSQPLLQLKFVESFLGSNKTFI